jgi:hypothetical protein
VYGGSNKARAAAERWLRSQGGKRR